LDSYRDASIDCQYGTRVPVNMGATAFLLVRCTSKVVSERSEGSELFVESIEVE